MEFATFFFLSVVLAAGVFADPEPEPDPKYGYGGGGEYDRGGYRKTGYHRKKVGYGFIQAKSCGKLSPPMNSVMKCSEGFCVATCYEHFVFPSGETSLNFACQGGLWHFGGVVGGTIPHCNPSCIPQCQNGGSCISPNTCTCPETYYGPYCQYEKKPCFDFPLTPMNAHKVCAADSCTMVCVDGHTFQDGSSVATVVCKEGEWVPARKEWLFVPDCLPTCSPTCQNGGICIGHNFCECPQDFRGPRCEFPKEACDPRKLGFNGSYKCSGDDLQLKCYLSCPVGMKFSNPPASVYSCLYETGIFSPSTVPSCVFGNDQEEILTYIFNGEDELPEKYQTVHESNKTSTYISKPATTSFGAEAIVIEKKKPKPGTCLTWRKEHFKTFDGKIISFKSDCVYTLATDVDNSFHVQTPILQTNCSVSGGPCAALTVYVNDKKYQLSTNSDKKAVVKEGTETMAVPAQLAGMKVELGAGMVKATLQAVGVTVLWNFKDVVEIKVAESNWNKTKGLCGTLDGYTNNDVTTNIEDYASDARILTTGDICQEKIMDSHPCSTSRLKEDAQQFCSALLNNDKLSDCSKAISVKEYFEACLWDYCSCNASNKDSCGCQSVEIFVRDCVSAGVSFPSWRDDNLCPMKCNGGRVYSQCGGETPCGGAERESLCEEGCFCPPGTYVHNDTCVSLDSCPCQLRGREFRPGTSVPKECNTCTCVKGQWSCTERECGAQCEAVGDPHYKTFDKKTYDFMGKCSYYLLKMDNYSIEAENVPCDGAISEDLGFLPYTASSGMPSCTKSVLLRLGDNVIKMKQGREVTVNGEDVKLPITVNGTYISQASSIFILADLPDGVEVWWDGAARLYINAPPSLKGKTKGLCGTFNNNQKDDFLTPEGDVEQDPISFANKWKTKDSCDNEVEEENRNPCDVNVQNKAEAEKLCSHITSNMFLDCHFYVDPITYYQNCLYDMCSCSKKKTECFCPIISAFVKECASHGIPVEWRSKIRECGLQCPRGQVYETCGKACSRSCTDLSREKKCSDLCLEGCNCPSGFVLDSRGVCIPIAQCPCIFNGLQYPPGHAEIRPASKGLNLCKCANAIWECHIANSEELKKYPNNSFEDIKCSSTKNQVYSHCEPEPVTCQNMHALRTTSSSEGVTPAICYGGCVCKKGYVLDSITKECVRPEECPCHHGGKSYKDGDQIQQLCNTCVCNMGKWECTDHHCSSTCTTWGDSHFKTFDGKLYDFQGTCDYVLAKGSLSKTDWFTVTLEMTSCGSSGISCTRSVKLTIATDGSKESVSFEDGKAHLFESSERIKLREAGLFLFAEVFEMGLVVQWDKATRVTVRADPKWKGKMKGLCGNYNDDSDDDFQTPSGGVSEVSSQLFGDSWKLHDYCPQSQPIKDTCAIRPNRKAWAVQKCSILKSNLFAPCHSEVAPDFYLNKCIFDTCGCDEGGDCECLCTTIAAYAQECNAHGVSIKWRTQQLCPMQCDETCSTYSPCVPTCPSETCDNFLNLKNITEMCKQDTCVEGCQFKKCKEGEIYFNSTKLECVPSALCKPVCMTVDGHDYYEGDLMEGDDCYSCYCSRNNKTCTGLPCTTPSTLPTTVPFSTSTTTVISNDKFVCISGWTGWINSSPLDIEKYNEIDSEPLPVFSSNQGQGGKGPQCQRENIAAIKCRTIGTHKSPKETMEDVECTLEKGLFCKNGCSDYEIQVLCQCENTTSPTTVSTTVTPPSTVPLLSTTISTPGNTPEIILPSTFVPTHLTSTTQEPIITSTLSETETTQTKRIKDVTTPEIFTKPTPEESKTEATVGVIKTTLPPVENSTTTTSSTPTTTSACPENQVWDECSIKCDQLCLYYETVLYQNGVCSFGQKCSPGCRDKNRPDCEEGYRWRDKDTCVKEENCICRSFTGEIVKPGKVVKESDCKSCQCLNNHYSCDDSACETTATPTTSEKLTSSPITESTIIIVSVVTPPVEACKDNRWLPLLNDMPSTAFKSSSVNPDPKYSPDHVKMSSLDGSWKPGQYDFNQHLEIDLGRPDVIYGLTVKGDIFLNEYVTNYHVLYSLDGVAFSYIMYNDLPQVFKGPSYHLDSQFQMFIHPIEARYVRINPVNWIGAPAMKIELYGCQPSATSIPTEDTPSTTVPSIETTVTTETPEITSTNSPVCTDKMSNYMNDGQIKVSSSKVPVTANLISVYNGEGWAPLVSNPDQWLQFDFLGERTLTGVMTSGGGFELSKVLPSWVMSYYILYSPDENNWSPVLGTDGTKKLFYGNKDNTNIKTNIFLMPIRARYIRIVPFEWHNSIALRAQMLGCYEPYPILTTTTLPPTTVREDCNVCPGVTLSSKICPCQISLWWDGEQCGRRAQCPCVVGFMTYAVGTTYDNEQCEQCTCTLNGISQCKEKECPPCLEGLKKTLTSSCDCTCKPCPEKTKLCPSSNICINETFWCDGISDCIDDELNCAKPSPSPRTLITEPPTTEVSTTVKPCPPPPICGPGSKLEKVVEPEKVAPFWSPFGKKSKWGSYFKGNTRSRKGYGYKGLGHKRKQHKGIKTNHQELSKVVETPVCDQYICTCLKKPTECPPGSKLIVIKAEKEGECDQFDCFVPPDKICKVTGRTFKTFDGTEYKYDICNHTIVRDRLEGEWDARLVKQCPFIGPCSKFLVIRYDGHNIIMYTDQSIVFDGYAYTIPQMQKIGAQTEEFTIKQVNNKFIIFSSSLGFSIIWDSHANVKVVVPGTKKGEVDGLCGLLDDNPSNDKQKPNGDIAKTSIDFGNSWGDSAECETKVCPVHLQKEAFEMCKAIRDDPLSRCSTVMNMDKIHSQCVEAICLCSENSNNTEACRCDAILKAVTECQDALPDIDLTQWRIQNDCPASCPPGLVFKECYKHTCEPCCAELMTPDACPETNECFPGCYCPDGYVRKFEECIRPAECRDCICEGYSGSRFVTFDKIDYTYAGNCTHVLAETDGSLGPQFKVLITNGPCEDHPSDTCLKIISILYKDYSIQAINNKDKTISVKINGELVTLPQKEKWLSVSEMFGKGILVQLPTIQLDLEMLYGGRNFKLKLPSHFYSNRTRGLCGKCNVNETDDLTTRNGTITDNINDFGQSWLLKDLPPILEKEDSCSSEVFPDCLPPPPDKDDCLLLSEGILFGKCHPVVDPAVFIANCHKSLCNGATSVCRELEAYARECQDEGVCLKWRSSELCPFVCPQGLIYEGCGLGCTETCDNYELYRKSPEKCLAPRGDTCVCPSNKVVKNGTCVAEEKCTPCDNEGHYPGDKWNPDHCTECGCTKSSVHCERIQCPQESICKRGFKSVTVVGTESDCCPKVICVPLNETCPPPKPLKCGPDQLMKLEADENGCNDFICVCKPKEECANITSELQNLEEGFVALMDSNGCCSFINKTCQPELCPTKTCPEFYVPVKKAEGLCCPVMECEIPEDHCLYEFENGNNEGNATGKKVLKSAGDEWKDGPCRTCECKPGSKAADCKDQVCATPPESDSYIYKSVNQNNKCCPIYKRTACKHENKIYQVGESWQNSLDFCRNGTCTIGTNGEVVKEDSVQTCDKNCKEGWKYFAPPEDSKICCGECRPVACVINNTQHEINSVWNSEDNCTTFTCLLNDNQVQVVSSKQSCPAIEDCPNEDIYFDGCCKQCNRTKPEPQSECTTEPVPLNSTIRMIHTVSDEHGPCVNTEPIFMNHCKGVCDSSTEFDWRNKQHLSNCLCCQGRDYDKLDVVLNCADGYSYKHSITHPTSCDCQMCQGSLNLFQRASSSKKGSSVKGR
ncbi:unnamed protein product [Nezara viridula]|uniref:Hemocytin n=1 Tax=Nezara viridula TaxID=85310 RepID=A0A9P0HMR7_NEZVI|nr:unnamed protein product [Nezara viridula]